MQTMPKFRISSNERMLLGYQGSHMLNFATHKVPKVPHVESFPNLKSQISNCLNREVLTTRYTVGQGTGFLP